MSKKSQNRSNFKPQSAATVAHHKRVKAQKHARRMEQQASKALRVPRGTAREQRGGSLLQPPVVDFSAMAWGFRHLQVEQSAYTEKGAEIGSHIARGIKRGLGVSPFQTNSYKLSFRTHQSLKEQGVLA